MKLIGGDSGRYEREEFVEEAVLAPSERAVVDVLFTDPGFRGSSIEPRIGRMRMALITVTDERAEPSLERRFHDLRRVPEAQSLERRGVGAISRGKQVLGA